jgi:phenylalanyl-tRNA synthetase beta chain
MKISLQWLKEIIPLDLNIEALKDLLTDIGLEVESIEDYTSMRGLDNVVIGKVVHCEKHPDADRLSLTKVDIGAEDLLQIVCGAPNVAQGQIVVVAKIGATLYPYSGEPFAIKKSKIRGIESEGMICASDELGIDDNHAGIIVITDDVRVGTSAAEYFKVYQDTIIEIGLTPNRNDAYSHYGVARDLWAALKIRNGITFDLPKISTLENICHDNPVHIEVVAKDKCPRYAGIVIQDVKVKPSPEWLVNRLKSIGQKPINNIVDITNYCLHYYGQPLHAFDWDAITDHTIVVRNAYTEEKFVSLDGIERTLRGGELLIADAKHSLCMAGIYGGMHSGVNISTTSIFLESAYFSPSSIRQSSQYHQLRTDAAQHFEKSIDPEHTTDVLLIAAKLIEQYADGKIASKTYDVCPSPILRRNLQFDIQTLNKYSGLTWSNPDVEKIFAVLDIEVISKENTKYLLNLPAYRYDVNREVDVIEEILRIYGYNRLPIPDKINTSITYDKNKINHTWRSETSQVLKALGFREIMNNSLSKSKYYEQKTLHTSVKLLSSINTELDILRPSMLPGMLETIQYNYNHGVKHGKFFEFGNIYAYEEKYMEIPLLVFASYGEVMDENIFTPNLKSNTYYQKGLLSLIFENWKLSDYSTEIIENTEDLDFVLQYKNRHGVLLAYTGTISQRWKHKFDLKTDVYFTVMHCNAILKMLISKQNVYKEISKYPSIRRDLAILLDEHIQFEDVNNIALKYGKTLLQKIEVFDIFRDKQKLGDGKKSMAISMIFKDTQKTLLDEEIDVMMQKIMRDCEEKLGGLIRK